MKALLSLTALALVFGVGNFAQADHHESDEATHEEMSHDTHGKKEELHAKKMKKAKKKADGKKTEKPAAAADDMHQ